MSPSKAKYPPSAPFNAAHAVRWFKKHMGIADWHFDVKISADAPIWAGTSRTASCQCKVAFKHAWIWMTSTPDLHNNDCLGSIQATLFHEMLHIVFDDSGIEKTDQDTSDHTEFVLNRLACILAAAYLADVEVYR